MHIPVRCRGRAQNLTYACRRAEFSDAAQIPPLSFLVLALGD
jgi:hypothetical protein